MRSIFILTLLFVFISCKPKSETTHLSINREKEVSMKNILNPSLLNEKAPDSFKVRFNTTKGSFVIEVKREWSPNGADRFYNLAKNGFYNNTAFFRVLKGFVAQFGINGDPKVSAIWRNATIPDDEVKISNTRGTVSFATAGPNTRTTQIFINYSDNSRLDKMGFSPFGRVIEGMEVVDSLYSDYGEGEPYGKGPSQAKIQIEGNEYLKKNFPNLDYIISANIEP